MTLQEYMHRYPDPHKGKKQCPYCVMGSGPMSSLSIGYDEVTKEIINSGTRDVCDFCNGTGWLDVCPTCGGSGGIKR